METKTLRHLAGTIREYRDRMMVAVICRMMSNLDKKDSR